jgi:hypothetical protein
MDQRPRAFLLSLVADSGAAARNRGGGITGEVQPGPSVPNT